MDDHWEPSLGRRSRSRSRSPSRGRYDGYDRNDRRGRRRSESPRDWRRVSSRRRSPISPPRRRSRSQSRDRDRRRRSPVAQKHRQPPRLPPPTNQPPAVGGIFRARVVSVRPFGAFVELPGYHKQGLVHASQVSEDVQFSREEDDEMKVKALEYFLPRGEQVWVKVVEVRTDGRDLRIACSMRAVSQEDGRDLDPDNVVSMGRGGGGVAEGRLTDQPPELYSIHKAVVQSVRPFGAFVQMDGYRKFGLVHLSQISDHMGFQKEDSDAEKVAAISEVVAPGETVWVKVVDIKEDERGPKVGCSIKLVSQRDGADLDPQNVKYRPRQEGGGGFGMQQPIGAAAGAAQDAVVDWGHLKADVVQYGGGGRQYEILAGDSGGEGGAPERGPPSRPPPPLQGTGANTAPLPPRGRGRGNVLPAWMTGGGDGSAAPGAAAAAPPPPTGGVVPGKIETVEDALVILESYGAKRRHKDKGKKKHHKLSKKEKHHKEKSARKHRRRSRTDSSGSERD